MTDTHRDTLTHTGKFIFCPCTALGRQKAEESRNPLPHGADQAVTRITLASQAFVMLRFYYLLKYGSLSLARRTYHSFLDVKFLIYFMLINLTKLMKNNWRSVMSSLLYDTCKHDCHARNVAKACNFHTRALRHVRSLLTDDVAQTVA